MKLNYSNTDTYIQKENIIKAITSNLTYFNGNLLDVGCGKMPYKRFILEKSNVISYTGIDVELDVDYYQDHAPDILFDGVTIPLPNHSFDTVIATEVLEHCPEPLITIKEIHRVLKPGGIFFFTVPYIWNIHEWPYDFYRYTPKGLEYCFKTAGFTNFRIYSYGGWHSSLAQLLGLWIQRSDINKTLRSILIRLIVPIMKTLIKHDKSDKQVFMEGSMPSGLYGICIK